MNFSEYLNNKKANILHITRKDILRTITAPQQKQKLQLTELTVLLFLRKEQNADSYLLVIGELRDDLFILGNCLRVRSELIVKVGTDEPLVILRQLAENFGFKLRFDEKEEKFLFREAMKVPLGTFNPTLATILPPKGREEENFQIVYSLYNYYRREVGIVEVALAFALDETAYLSWLNKQTTFSVSPKKYDLFISYKRNTAQDFACALKKCLTQEGYTAFLDIQDIKKEFLGTDKWFTERDEAIRNSKRFLLLMTIKIDTSNEVAKELALARTIEKMRFIYMRHEDLKPQVKLRTNTGVEIDLSEGNQEAFTNENDLARKVLKILQDSEIPKT